MRKKRRRGSRKSEGMEGDWSGENISEKLSL